MATLNLDEILNYINPEPRYAGKLENLGLLEAGDLEAARKQSVFQGLLGAGLGYLAQPKNQGYGSILPYFAKAGMQGLQASKAPYEQLTQDALMNQKLKEVEYQRGERKYQDDQRVLAAEKLAERNKILKDGGLFETVLTDRPNLPIAPEQLTLPSGEQSVRPVFGTTPQAPTATQEINFDTINRLYAAGEIPDAKASIDIAEKFKNIKNPKLKSKVIDDYLIFTDDFGNIVSKTKVGDDTLQEERITRKTLAADGTTVLETPIIQITRKSASGDKKIIGYRDIKEEESVPQNSRAINVRLPSSPPAVTNASSLVTKRLVKNIYPKLDIDLDEAGYVESLANAHINRQKNEGVIVDKVDAIKYVIEKENLIDKGTDIGIYKFNDDIDINRSPKVKKPIDAF
mgnify:CR=1 FL=1|tara:strand:+ start:579 stop:1781 length:1203 start_codon:yes stop_codon:yes gene_type:complete